MSSAQSTASEEALQSSKGLAQQYYGVATPALAARMGGINQQLAQGEPAYLQQAYAGQRAGLAEGMAAQGGAAQAQQMAGSKQALSGGNPFAAMHPADVGAQLANALYGSKFQEGQANLNQQFNLMSMGLGGAGTAGNAALTASGNQLGAIGMMPNYNTGYANIVGAGAGLSSIYGAVQPGRPGRSGTSADEGTPGPCGSRTWSNAFVVGSGTVSVIVKPGVLFDVIAPAGYKILIALKSASKALNLDLTITSGTDGQHSGPLDPHHEGEAYDIRTHDFDGPTKTAVLQAIMQPLGWDRFYGTIEAPGLANEHIHCQRKIGTRYTVEDLLNG